MASFDDLPSEIRCLVMCLRAEASYREAQVNACRWDRGNGWVYKKAFLKDICRSNGLRVSGTVAQLLFRIREHKQETLAHETVDSIIFWGFSYFLPQDMLPK